MLLVLGVVLLMSILFLTGCGRYGGSEEIYSKEVLSANSKDVSRSYDYAAEYIDRWDFPRFDIRKMREVENLFLERYLYILPSASTHAQAIGELFLEKYYDKINLNDPSEVTDALLECYTETTGDVWARYRDADEAASFSAELSGKGESSVSYSIKSYLGSEVGYIKISSFRENTAEQFVEAIDYMEEKNVPGFVFDLRDNSGGAIEAAAEALGYLVPVDKKIVTIRERGRAADVIRSTMTHSISVPCVVLCNEKTASSAELFVAAMRDFKTLGIIDVTVIGEETYGKGILQSTLTLSDSSSVTLTTAYFDPPLDVNLTESGKGVSPDVLSVNTQGTSTDQQLDDGLDHLSYLVQLYSGTLDKDRFHEKIVEAMEKNEGYSYKYFSEYLKRWNFPIYDNTKLHEVQDIFESWINPSLSSSELAYLSAKEFIYEYYDSLSVSKKSETTDALIKAWLAVCDEYGIYRTEKEARLYLDEINGRTVGIGISFEQISHKIIKVSEGSDAYGKILEGDVLAAVNGIEYTFKGEDTRDNHADIVKELTDSSKETFKITVTRNGERKDFTVKRGVVDYQSVLWKVYEDVAKVGDVSIDVAWLTISAFNAKTFNQFKAAVDELKGKVDAFVFDIRSNLGGPIDIAIKCIDYLVYDTYDGHKTPITSISYFKDGRTDTRKSEDGHSIGKTPCIVVTNEYTTAAAELFASALKDYNSMGLMNTSVVGRTTFGKGVMQETKSLYDKSAITITVAKYYPPLGEISGYDGKGVTPTVNVPVGASSQDFFDAAIRQTGVLYARAHSN